ncbi:MAG: anthranilate phosphoribosyltransferase [Opitutales bacterium]
MQAIEQLTEAISAGRDLSAEEAAQAACLLASGDVGAPAKKAFLLALASKGETSAEVAAFARTFRDYALDPGVEAWAGRAIDVCGTGGDGSGTFNISTAVSFVVAASGVPVFKHGNRSITSKCGSADLLEALGIRLDAPVEQIRASLEQLNFCFFFAPCFHPAFKEVMPVRKELAAAGQRSVFNLLGPLINPGRPAYQLLGVYAADWVDRLAAALGELHLEGGLVVHGLPGSGAGLDELSCAGTNRIRGFGAMSGQAGPLSAEDVGLPACGLGDLKGGATEANLAIMEGLLSGRPDAVPPGLRDSVLLNAGAALWITGRAGDLKRGVAQAEACLASGQVGDWLDRVRSFYQKG